MYIRIGNQVSWKWLNSVASGEIIGISYEKTQIESKGKLITRNGTKDNPAVIIKHKNGNLVIKLKSELISK